MRHWFTAAICLWPALAQGNPSPAFEKTQACYAQAAIFYGLRTCDPPATIVAAVFGACDTSEQTIRREIIAQRPDQELAETTVEKLRERSGPIIQGWILDARIKAGVCH